jgi:hypothetical protein
VKSHCGRAEGHDAEDSAYRCHASCMTSTTFTQRVQPGGPTQEGTTDGGAGAANARAGSPAPALSDAAQPPGHRDRALVPVRGGHTTGRQRPAQRCLAGGAGDGRDRTSGDHPRHPAQLPRSRQAAAILFRCLMPGRPGCPRDVARNSTNLAHDSRISDRCPASGQTPEGVYLEATDGHLSGPDELAGHAWIGWEETAAGIHAVDW